MTFLGDDDYQAYLRRLAVYRSRHAVTLLAYCLMPNHVHLLVHTGDVPLAKFMQGLQQSYTQWFNRLHGKVGHVFQGRYRAIVWLAERLTGDEALPRAASRLEKCREVKV